MLILIVSCGVIGSEDVKHMASIAHRAGGG